MTRSGVFNSVHAFTQSDIGPTFLVFIAIVLVFSVLLLATRGHLLVAETGLDGTLSRGTFLVVATVVFAVFMVMVLNGTLFPLITEARAEQEDQRRRAVLQLHRGALRPAHALPDGRGADAAVGRGVGRRSS